MCVCVCVCVCKWHTRHLCTTPISCHLCTTGLFFTNGLRKPAWDENLKKNPDETQTFHCKPLDHGLGQSHPVRFGCLIGPYIGNQDLSSLTGLGLFMAIYAAKWDLANVTRGD